MTNTETLASQTRKTVTAADLLATALTAGGWVDGLGNKGTSIEFSYDLDSIYRRCGYTKPERGSRHHRQ